jgi:Insulinase (Peptidase family M16)
MGSVQHKASGERFEKILKFDYFLWLTTRAFHSSPFIFFLCVARATKRASATFYSSVSNHQDQAVSSRYILCIVEESCIPVEKSICLLVVCFGAEERLCEKQIFFRHLYRKSASNTNMRNVGRVSSPAVVLVMMIMIMIMASTTVVAFTPSFKPPQRNGVVQPILTTSKQHNQQQLAKKKTKQQPQIVSSSLKESPGADPSSSTPSAFSFANLWGGGNNKDGEKATALRGSSAAAVMDSSSTTASNTSTKHPSVRPHISPLNRLLKDQQPPLKKTPQSELLPMHPSVVSGVLDNGMPYIILPNKSPPGRFEAHLQVFSGSSDELEPQQGIAHLTEHVAYMGSRKRERLFGTGSQTNAYTGTLIYYCCCYYFFRLTMFAETDHASVPLLLCRSFVSYRCPVA